MLGNSIFGTLLSQVPAHSVSNGVTVNQAATNAQVLPGGLTVSVLQPSSQQNQTHQQQQQLPQSSHTQQIPLVSQHIPQQIIHGQSQQQQIQHQQQILPQSAQIIHAHQLTSQQQPLLFQAPSAQLHGQMNPLQNFVIVGAAPTMFVTNGTSGGNFLSSSAPGNFFVASAPSGLNVMGGLGGLVQTLTSTNQQPGTSIITANNSDLSIDATINQIVSSFSGSTSTPSGAHTTIAVNSAHQASVTSSRAGANASGGPFQCHLCERSYKYRHGLTQHVQQTHMGRRPFACSECGKGFTRKAQLDRHMNVHNGTHGTFTCADCGEEFHMRESYSLHIRTHGKTDDLDRSYRCELCAEEFHDKALLVKHYHTEHQTYPPAETSMELNKDPSAAPILDMATLATNSAKIIARRRKRAARRMLLASQQLQSNPISKGGGVGHVCDICGKRFLNHYGLKRHVRTHTGERPHDCDICGLSFMERSHMKQHRMTHTGETPYRCQYCNRGFNRKFSHERHIRWHTKGGLTYTGDGSAPTSAPTSMSEFLDTVVNEIVNSGIPTDSSTSIGKSETPSTTSNMKQESYVHSTPQNHTAQNIYLSDGNILPLGTSFTMHLNSISTPNQPSTHTHQPNVVYTTADGSSSSMNTLVFRSANGGDGANFLPNAVVSDNPSGHQMLSFTIPASSLNGSFNGVPVMTAVTIPQTLNGNTANGSTGKHV